MELTRGDACLLVALVLLLVPWNCSALECYSDKKLKYCEGSCMKVLGRSTKFPFSEATGCFTYPALHRITQSCAPFRSGQDTSNGMPEELVTSFLDSQLGMKEGTLCLCDSHACNTGTILGSLSITFIVLTVGFLLSMCHSST